MQCRGKTRRGKRCRLSAQAGSDYCHQHVDTEEIVGEEKRVFKEQNASTIFMVASSLLLLAVFLLPPISLSVEPTKEDLQGAGKCGAFTIAQMQLLIEEVKKMEKMGVT